MTHQSFNFSVPTAISFGEGVSENVIGALPAGTSRVAVIRGQNSAASAKVVALLRQHELNVTEVSSAGEPTVEAINAATGTLADLQIDAVVACGGGSVIDSGKAIALCLGQNLRLSEDLSAVSPAVLDMPGPVACIAIPTTAGTGAEVTANAVLGIPSQNAKVSLRGRALIPAVALVDPLLLPSAPRAAVLSSGLDAMVQIMESYISCAATPFTDALTLPSISVAMRALKDVMTSGSREGWRSMAWVSLCSGVSLANGGLGAAHGIASIIGGRHRAPHGALCGRLVVPVLRRNMASAPAGSLAEQRLAKVADAISEAFAPVPDGDAFSGLELWADRQGLARLAHFGVDKADIPELAQRSASASSSKKNAVELQPKDYDQIIRAAY